MELKIKRHIYEITETDIFMETAACVQLLTQSKEKLDCGHRPHPVLSKRAIKQIGIIERREIPYSLDEGVSVFGLVLTNETIHIH